MQILIDISSRVRKHQKRLIRQKRLEKTGEVADVTTSKLEISEQNKD